jgi:magnesium transporter
MLINCVAYQNGARLAELAVEEISDYLAIPDCFVWVALRDATPEEMEQMKLEFALHELAIEDAHHGHQRPKIEEYGDSVFAVMHLLEEERGELNVGEINVFIGRNYVLSVRNRSRHDFLTVRERCEREPHLLQQGAGFVLYALMDAVVDQYFPLIDQLESALEDIEDQIFAQGAARTNIQRLYGLKRQTKFLKHAVAPMMEATGRLCGGLAPEICVHSRDYFRDVHDHLARINASIDTIRETIATAIQVNLSMVTIEESEVTKRLAAWAGIFAVATFFVGVWGMNFEFMPELHWLFGYPFALVLMVLISSGLLLFFRRRRWL